MRRVRKSIILKAENESNALLAIEITDERNSC